MIFVIPGHSFPLFVGRPHTRKRASRDGSVGDGEEERRKKGRTTVSMSEQSLRQGREAYKMSG